MLLCEGRSASLLSRDQSTTDRTQVRCTGPAAGEPELIVFHLCALLSAACGHRFTRPSRVYSHAGGTVTHGHGLPETCSGFTTEPPRCLVSLPVSR
ncbi:hypothetical protein EYF80_038258 [Liparis tanakae]|uniref:Uncharacterized protein n=1 Tax=Liparis tanakae TaxID=230148 RepID=A0A4Z2GD71_9TELE|nr:hypothetical protein EYF80_038258 [Liparis tanakae]